MSEDRFSLRHRREQIMLGLKNLQDQIRQVLKLDNKVKLLAEDLYKKKSLLIMGRGFNFATCLEGALVSNDIKKKLELTTNPEYHLI